MKPTKKNNERVELLVKKRMKESGLSRLEVLKQLQKELERKSSSHSSSKDNDI